MKRDPIVEQHTVARSVVLHLLPGLLISLCYFLLRDLMHQWGYPSLMALMAAVALVLVPCELGTLILLGYKQNGYLSLQGIVQYRDTIPFRQYLIWVPTSFLLAGLVFTAFRPVDALVQSNLFAWLPDLESGLDGAFARSALIITYGMVALFGAVVGPVVEELYFRSYLLPRMQYAGRWALLLHSLLFALYHLFTPWMFVTRTFAMLPLIYAAKHRNVYVSIIVHFLLNMVDVIVGASFIISMT